MEGIFRIFSIYHTNFNSNIKALGSNLCWQYNEEKTLNHQRMKTNETKRREKNCTGDIGNSSTHIK